MAFKYDAQRTGRCITASRSLQNLTIDELAAKVPLPVNHLARMESGEADGPAAPLTAVRIANALRAHPEEIICYCQDDGDGITETYGQRIRRVRKELGMTRRQLADRIPGATKGLIRGIEADQIAPGPLQALVLAVVLRIYDRKAGVTGAPKATAEEDFKE